MKKTRRISTLLLAAAVLCMLAGCGGTPAASDTPSPSASDVASPSTSEESSPSPSESTPAVQPAQTEAEGSTGGGKTLIIYYSASGRTEAVAGYIANATGGDTFVITPVEPYTSDDLDWTDSDSRVSREHDDPSLRTMELTETAVDGWEDYDTVFIGYPKLSQVN